MGSVGTVETVRLAGHAQLFHQRQAGVRNIEQRILFGRVHGHAVLAGHGRIDELDDNVAAHALDVAVAPLFARERRRRAAAFLGRPFVAAAAGMRFLFVGRTVRNVHAAAVGLPTGDARREILIGVGDAAVVLFLELVFHRVRGGVAAQPEVLDELLALFIGLQPLEGGALFIGDDVRDVLVEPLAVG